MLDRRGEQDLEPREICDLGADEPEMVGGNLPDVGTARMAGTAEPENGADLVGREPEFARTPDEAKSAHVVIIIQPVPTLASRRRGEDASLLEIANRLQIDSRQT